MTLTITDRKHGAEQTINSLAAEPGVRAAMADQGTQVAMADPGTQAAMADPGTQAAMEGSPPQNFLGEAHHLWGALRRINTEDFTGTEVDIG